MRYRIYSVLLLACFGIPTGATKQVAYIHGDVAGDGTIPSGAAAPYDQMLLADTGNKGCSQFKAMIEAEGYTITQFYDQTNTLNAAFLEKYDAIVFGLHQKIWSAGEKAALDSWIRKGGGILMYSDSAAGGHYGTVGISNPTGQNAVNNILTQYGMEVTVDQGGGTRAYIPDALSPNPVIWDQPVFEGEGVSPIAVDPTSDAQVLIPLKDSHKVSGSSMTSPGMGGSTISNPEWAVIALTQVGQSNVIAIFDRQPMWNNGPGSDINEEDNKEVLRRIIRFLARDYGNSSEWIGMTANGLEMTYRQWSGGTGTPGIDYAAKNTLCAVEHSTNLVADIWSINSNWVEHVSTSNESAETEIATVRLLPDIVNPARFARVAVHPATNTPPSSTSYIAINCGSINSYNRRCSFL
jgi:hypothetical protein